MFRFGDYCIRAKQKALRRRIKLDNPIANLYIATEKKLKNIMRKRN